MNGIFHSRPESRSAGHSGKGTVNTLRFGVMKKPVVGDHVRQHVECAFGQNRMMLPEGTVNLIDKIGQGLGMIRTPVPGQEMIVKDIHNDTRVMVVLRPEALLALGNNGMVVGKLIDRPVQFNSLAYRRAVLFQRHAALHEITDKIPDHHFRFFAGQENMRQKIHYL